MRTFQLPQIRHDQAGYESLVGLFASADDCEFDQITVDLAKTSWFDADMCAAFGAILYHIGVFNTVRLENIPLNVEKILSKNGFLCSYGRKKLPDSWGTTIPYQRFDRKDDRYFGSYIEKEYVRRSEIPTMTPGLLKKFRESVFEIFSNAVLHSQTKLGIFACGQNYPKRSRLDFSVADLGIGIPRNVNETLGMNLPAKLAIEWATQGSNTTKRGAIPGGLGLKLLTEFVDLNGGRIQIISDAGYWERSKGQSTLAQLAHPFPGTVVNIEVNTQDNQSYSLTTEISEADIF